jgi:hypothetical protein
MASGPAGLISSAEDLARHVIWSMR